MNEINFRINDIKEIKMSMDVGIKEIYPPIENLEITPTKEEQVFTHENSYGYDEVVVEPIPDEYIIPDGTLDVDANGDVDVTMFRMARVGVYTPPNLQDKEITVTENGTQNIVADNEYDGLNQVNITVSVNSGGASEETPITSINELEQKLVSVAENHLNYLFDNVNTYETFTTDAVTLYTPSETNMYYVIRKRGDNLYAIIWFPKLILNYYTSSNISPCYFKCNSFSLLSPQDITNGFATYYTDNYTGYYTSNFSSVEECISALQNPNTSYLKTTNNSWGSYMEGDYLVPYTNLPCIKGNVLIQSRRISNDEKIEVI